MDFTPLQYVEKAITFLQQILKIFSFSKNQLKISFNGGKDATIVLYLTKMAMHRNANQEQIQCIYFVENDPFPQISEFVENQKQSLNLKIDSMQSNYIEGLKSFPELQAVIMGTRRCDPHGKNIDMIATTDSNFPPMLRINPILDWKYNEVWDFIRQYKIPYCDLYNQGYTSIGCKSNTKKNDNWKEGQAVWEMEEDQERNTRVDQE